MAAITPPPHQKNLYPIQHMQKDISLKMYFGAEEKCLCHHFKKQQHNEDWRQKRPIVQHMVKIIHCVVINPPQNKQIFKTDVLYLLMFMFSKVTYRKIFGPKQKQAYIPCNLWF